MPKANSPLVKIEDVPDVPAIGTAVAGAEEALVAFTPAVTGGKAALYRALSTPDSIEATGSTSPILVPGLTAGTSYTFQVRGEANTGATTGYSADSNSVVPFEPPTYELIESQVLSSSASSITFSSIPQDFKHLQLRMLVRSTSYAQVYMRLNGVGAAGAYAYHEIFGGGSSVASQAWPGSSNMKLGANNWVDAPTGAFGGLICDILDYSSSTKNTTTRTLSGSHTSPTIIRLASGVLLDTSPVTSLEIYGTGDSYSSGSRFSLYGIRG